MKHRIRRKGAVTGAAATAAVTLAIVGAVPASAADYWLGPDDVVPFEIGDESDEAWNYNQWHVSQDDLQAELGTFVTFNECSITFNEDPRGAQHVISILKGYDIDARPVADGALDGETDEFIPDVSQWRELIDSLEIEVIEGDVTLQLPVFAYWGGASDADPAFTTLRNAVSFGPGVHTLAGVELTESGDLFGLGYELVPANLDRLLGQIEFWIAQYGDIFEILAVGFAGSAGAEVASISFGGDTYYFGTGDCAPVVDDEVVDDGDDLAGDDDVILAPTPPASVETDA